VGYGPSPRCVCETHRNILDHGRIWLDADGGHVLTGEPYGTRAEELAVLTADAKDLGLKVEVSDDSPWFPGSTVLVYISKETP
jgi:hypothetical protein